MLSDSQKLDLILESLSGVHTRLERVDVRMDGFEKRMDTIDQGIGALDQRIGTLEKRMDTLGKRMDRLEKRVEGLEARVEGFDMRLTLELDKMRLENAQGFRAMRQELTDELSVLRRDFNKEILEIRQLIDEHFKHFTETVFNLGEYLSKRNNALEQRFVDYWDKATTAMDASAKQYEKFFIEKAAFSATLDRHETSFAELKASEDKQNGAIQALQKRAERIEASRA